MICLNYKNIKPSVNKGAEERILSILSRIPPCPGRIFPLSLIFAFLFNILNVRSPTTDNKPIAIEKDIKTKLLIKRYLDSLFLII